MEPMSRRIRAMALVCLASLVVVACGSDGTGPMPGDDGAGPGTPGPVCTATVPDPRQG